ncbi:MAG: molybdopterin molybdotransferase MoeA [Phycisphaerae bacterium]|nr:molybdopterin molybdotransferase MoeA [Phycisphaerae bacterium]
MIGLKEALQIVLDWAKPLGTERVELRDALGRILAQDVASDMDMPPFDKATMDGYACRRADLGNSLTVVETIPAGAVPARAVGPNQCAKIMTGAAVPQGADCVIMIEQTKPVGWAVPTNSHGCSQRMVGTAHPTPVGEDVVRFTGEQTPDNIFRKAMDIKAGQVVLQKSGRISPQHIAVLASVGCVQPLVAKRPRVGVVASGDELVAPAARPGPAQIRNSNGSQLTAQLAAMGLNARDYGIVKDVASDIDAVFKRALVENDVVIVSAGVSVGDFDLVPAVLRQNQVRLLFEKIAVKPGKPTVFGISERGYCFGLPGNPVSTFVVFELLVKSFLYKLMGHDYLPTHVQMRLDETITRRDTDRQSWNPVRITSEATVEPVQYYGSAHLSALCEAGGLVPMEIGVASIRQGTPVRVRLL